MKATHPHIAAMLFNRPLMIHRSKLHAIIRAIGPRLGLDVNDEFDDEEDMTAPEGRGGTSGLVDGIATITAYGTLVKRSVGMDAMSGLENYEGLSAEVMEAATNPECRGILLDVDSYGGEVGGAFDLSDLIYRARQTVPVYGIANCYAYSAGYAALSACEKVFVTQDGGVGSIGVIAEHCDQSEYDAKIGLKFTSITFGAHKNDFSPHSALSKGALEDLHAEIDSIGHMFVALVARNRNMDPKAVLATQARLYSGQAALDAGLADQIGTRQDALDELKARIGARKLVPMPGQAAAAASAEATTLAAAMEAEEVEKAALRARVAAAAAAMALDAASAGTEKPGQTHEQVQQDLEAQAKASALAISNKEQSNMPETNTADATNDSPPDVEAIRLQATKDARAEYSAYTRQITALCLIADEKDLAAGFISEGLTVSQVQEKLLAKRAEASQARDTAGAAADLQTEFLPQGEVSKAAVNNPNRLKAAVERLLKARTGRSN